MKFVKPIIAILFFVSLASFYSLTDSNPTFRQYSSSPPQPNDSGVSAEQILSRDLRVQRNEEIGQCICNSTSRNRCNLCFVDVPVRKSFRIPDFVTPHFIAESKDRASMQAYNNEIFEQIEDYASAAFERKIPLWIYVRVDTEVDQEYYNIARSTGGGVVHYFTKPDYDYIQENLTVVILILTSGLMLIIVRVDRIIIKFIIFLRY